MCLFVFACLCTLQVFLFLALEVSSKTSVLLKYTQTASIKCMSNEKNKWGFHLIMSVVLCLEEFYFLLSPNNGLIILS